MNAVTDRQKEALDLIRAHIAREGRPPTVRELAAALGVSSTCSAHKHVRELRAKGLLRPSSRPGTSGSLIPVGSSEVVLTHAEAAGLSQLLGRASSLLSPVMPALARQCGAWSTRLGNPNDEGWEVTPAGSSALERDGDH
jgi:SOS-response transcriptional repressor LexA